MSTRTSKLLFGGTAKMAQKVIEEAAEPNDVWNEMDRREALLGIAEKLPKVE